jgi:hypothetical protein
MGAFSDDAWAERIWKWIEECAKEQRPYEQAKGRLVWIVAQIRGSVPPRKRRKRDLKWRANLPAGSEG